MNKQEDIDRVFDMIENIENKLHKFGEPVGQKKLIGVKNWKRHYKGPKHCYE